MVAQLRERKVWSTVERACAVIEQSAEWWHRARGGVEEEKSYQMEKVFGDEGVGRWGVSW